MQQPHSTTDDAQDHASLRGQFQDLWRPGGDTSFQYTGVSHVDAVVTSITHQPSLVATSFPQQSSLTTAVMSSYSGTSEFPIYQFQLPQQTTKGQEKRDDFSTFPDFQFQLPQQKKKGREKRDHFLTFKNCIPQTAETWQEETQASGLTTTDGIRATFHSLILLNTPVPSSTSSTDLDAIKGYVTSGRRRSAGADSKRPAGVATIRDVIFLGECDMALELGADLLEVNDALKKYLSSSVSNDVLRHYRKVPRQLSVWMNKLYEDCGRAAFELFLHANRPISAYDALARSANIATFFPEKVLPLIPTEVRKKGLQTDLAFYLPFLIWASILLNTKIDCFDELRRRNFPLAGHTSADFRRCLSFLGEGHPEISLALAQSTHNAQPVEVDAADANVTRHKRSAARGPQSRAKRARTCHRPPDDPAAPHHRAEEAITEKGASEDVRAGDFDRRNHDAAENLSHGGAQQLAAPHPPSRAAGSGNAVHCGLTSFATGHEPPGCPPPEQLSYPPGPPPQGPPQGYVYVAAGIDVPMASCNIGQPDNASAGIVGCVPPEGAPEAWTSEGHCGPYAGALGCGAAGVGSVVSSVVGSATTNTGSGQIYGVELCVAL